jgi:hypothetical protein
MTAKLAFSVFLLLLAAVVAGALLYPLIHAVAESLTLVLPLLHPV